MFLKYKAIGKAYGPKKIKFKFYHIMYKFGDGYNVSCLHAAFFKNISFRDNHLVKV